MSSCHAHSVCPRVALVLCALVSWSCRPRPSPRDTHAGARALTEQDARNAADAHTLSAPLTSEELALFDQLVTDELLFPDASERLRYDSAPKETTDDQRHYGFALKLEPGMREGRHFHVIDIAIARAGGAFAAGVREPNARGTGGPNGGFVEITVRTSDGAYDVRVSEGMLLVDPVKEPRFSLQETARALLQRYDALRGRAPSRGRH